MGCYPLSWDYRGTPWPVGLALLCALLLPGLILGFRRFRSTAEFYLSAYFVLMVLMGGNTSHERYVVPVVPLLLYYGYQSLTAPSAWLSAKLAARGGSAARGRLLWAVRHLAVLVGVVLLTYAARDCVRHRRGARTFGPQQRAAARRRVAAWKQAAGWVDRYVPHDATIYGPWSRIHFFTERRAENPAKAADLGLELGHVWACGASFTLLDRYDVSRLYVDPLIVEFPRCFTPVCVTSEIALYRVERERIEQTLKTLGVDVARREGGEYKKDDDGKGKGRGDG